MCIRDSDIVLRFIPLCFSLSPLSGIIRTRWAVVVSVRGEKRALCRQASYHSSRRVQRSPLWTSVRQELLYTISRRRQVQRMSFFALKKPLPVPHADSNCSLTLLLLLINRHHAASVFPFFQYWHIRQCYTY